eukprot:4775909-Alexandrium_andersonii.AAC.1
MLAPVLPAPTCHHRPGFTAALHRENETQVGAWPSRAWVLDRASGVCARATASASAAGCSHSHAPPP